MSLRHTLSLQCALAFACLPLPAILRSGDRRHQLPAMLVGAGCVMVLFNLAIIGLMWQCGARTPLRAMAMLTSRSLVCSLYAHE